MASQETKSMAEPSLYENIDLYPSPPHDVSYSHLKDLLTKLILSNDKIRSYTKCFMISGGWCLNGSAICEVRASGSNVPGKPQRVNTANRTKPPDQKSGESEDGEGVLNDGGIREINLLLNGFLRAANRLEFLRLETSIPLVGYVFERMQTRKKLNQLVINLQQPQEAVQNKIFETSSIPRYRPAIGQIGQLEAITHLKLSNIPHATVWDGSLIGCLVGIAKTIIFLTLDAALQHSCDHHSSSQTLNVLPPLGLHGFAAKAGCKMNLRAFCLRGFMIDQNMFSNGLNEGTLATLELRECESQKLSLGFFLKGQINQLVVEGWSFVSVAVAVSASSNTGQSICFSAHTPGDRLQTAYCQKLLGRASKMTKLNINIPSALPTQTLIMGLKPTGALCDLLLPLTEDQWAVFLELITQIKTLRRVVVLPLDGACTVFMADYVVSGGTTVPRGPAMDAEDIVKALKKESVRLHNVGVGHFMWRVDWDRNGKWRLRRAGEVTICPKIAISPALLQGARWVKPGETKLVNI
jgi:hypothetical protein